MPGAVLPEGPATQPGSGLRVPDLGGPLRAPGAPTRGLSPDTPAASPTLPDSEVPGLNAPAGALGNTPVSPAMPEERPSSVQLPTPPLEPALAEVPQSFPALPLAIVYGLALPLSAAYLWYTARKAKAEEPGH